jgi:tetratricopeptide (TPR) repeat protein
MNDQERRWELGERPGVEDYLRDYPRLTNNPDAVVALLVNEFLIRQHAGEEPQVEQFGERFPQYRDAFAVLLGLQQSLAAGMRTPRSSELDGQSTEVSLEALFDTEDTEKSVVALEDEVVDGSQTPLAPSGLGVAPSTRLPSPRTAVAPSTDGAGPVEVPGYQLLQLIGRGGMGVVYKAKQLSLRRVVALKTILNADYATAEARRRLRKEAEAVAQLAHPNIVQVYEIGEHGGRPYFSLEYCPGGSLEKRLDGTPWEGDRAATLVKTLAEALHAAHGAGIIHRDLKPANVLLTADGTPKVTDFGLAKRVDLPGQTESGALLGTPSYMATEQACSSKEITPAADVYSLGAILYELLTGRPPFKAATVMETVYQVVNVEPVPVRRLQPRTPRDLETICHKCLQKEPHKRYASAQALADDLNRFLAREPIQARRIGWIGRGIKWARRRPTAAALVGLLVALAIGLPIAGVAFYAERARTQATEQKHLDEAKAEIRAFLGQAETAANGRDYTQARVLLERALAKIAADPELAELCPQVEAALAPVQARLEALDVFQRFLRDRDEALFYGTLATGENFHSNRRTAQEKARAALSAIALSPDDRGPLTLDAWFTTEEKAEITTGSYALLLLLAETEARRLPQDRDEDHRQRLRQALALLDRADGLAVKTRAIHLARARYRKALGDGDGARLESGLAQALQPATDLDPQDHFLVGHELYTRGEVQEAMREFHRALQLNPEHFWTHYFLGICCVISERPDVAVIHLSFCQSKQPKLVWIYLLRGFARGQMKDYVEAEADFDRALALQPSPATLYVLYNNRGVMRVGRKGEAWASGIEDLKNAALLRPEQYQAHASMAEAYRLANHLQEARRQLDEAVVLARRQLLSGDIKPETLALLHYSRARLHLQRSDQPAAVRDLEEAARLAETDRVLRARAHADRGRVLHLQNQIDAALTAYDQALKANPEAINVHLWRGEVLLMKPRYAEAAAAFDAYLDRGGAPSVAVYRQRGLARAKSARHAEAIADFARALESKPKDEELPLLYLSRGQEYLAINALQPALRDFEEVFHLDPDSPDAHLGRALVRVKLGEPLKGIADAARAVEREPEDPRLWHSAARVYAQAAGQLRGEASGDIAEIRLRSRYQLQAVLLLRKALAMVPDGERQGYWRDNVKNDAALFPLRRVPEFVQLAIRLNGQAD